MLPLLAAALGIAVLPQPQNVHTAPCTRAFARGQALRVPANFDEGAREEINERWTALGLPRLAPGKDIQLTHVQMPAQAYRLLIDRTRIVVQARDGDGFFYGAMTLAQLARPTASGWQIPCANISDAPALKWRVLSDDVSRGPLPTMRYFKERIRTIAFFKMNGYSPYMEHVFLDPRNPLPAPLDGITSEQLRELNAYAKRFHVTFIPEQQSFAHMHNTLRVEQYAGAAELPHGYLMSPINSLTYSYLQQVIGDELSAVPHPPFFHLGADEPSDLGRGQSAPAVQSEGVAKVYAQHVSRVAAMLPRGTRPMFWDDAMQRHPDVFNLIPKNSVIITWHYGDEKSYLPYINLIKQHGFDQMAAPGALNWNEIYPDLTAALQDEKRFVDEAKGANVLGLFQTVWHDDGETLFEATWYPVLFSASDAWQRGTFDPNGFARAFDWAFFGSNNAHYAHDMLALGDIDHVFTPGLDTADYLFWSDPLDPSVAARVQQVDVRTLRLRSEAVLTDLWNRPPALHRNAAQVMELAARRFDYLGRQYQIGSESRYYYNDAKANADGKHNGIVYRGLFISKYLFWELRDNLEELKPLYARAWDYENRASHRGSVLARYDLAAQKAIERADAINRATYEDYAKTHTLPDFDTVVTPRYDAGPRS